MNNKNLIIIVIIAFVIIVAMLFLNQKTENYSNDVKAFKETDLIKMTNNKIVIVKNLKQEYLEKAIEQFIDFSKGENTIKPKITIFNDKLVITFPYDIEFDTLCYFINYLEYAHDLSLKPDYKPEVYGWYKTKKGDEWMTKEIVNKEVLIFIPETDDEYDNVYVTTEDNLGFKMGFALGYEHEKLAKPVIPYMKRPINKSDLENYKSIDY
ncbi:hypothetical protein [Aurantibacter aestuarii]|uniref:Uncharacterized protein n=1 Tax=Aurantibacter aestuarii TaxID=1266046 RepID=A0A2T1NDQ4_9FLAO|nr:hypothetical protein [Aurantibacter aestuarii]PSG90529.1 hypothetical protein C7H52_04410 [Aurantibacter aestuarii]